MIGVDLLKLLLERYGIDPNKVIKNNENVLVKGNYDEIEDVIKYLIGELKISPKNIEKAPSILYFNVSAIRKNVEFLQKQHISFSNVETCLHVLNTEPFQLEETYNYIMDNYGVEFINRITSILGVNVERIKEIEKLNLDKDTTLSAAVSRLSIDDIVADVQICRENNVDLKDNVTVFNRTADEIKDIIEVCRENNIKITGSVFSRAADKLQSSMDFIKEHYDSSYLTPLIIVKDAKHLSKVFPYLDELGVLGTVRQSASILGLPLDDIRERKNFIDSIGEPMVLENGKFNSVFGMSRKRYAERVSNVKKNSDGDSYGGK